MRIATWNVNSLRVRLPQVLDWLARNPVDVLAIQETKVTDEAFPSAEIEAASLYWVHNGQKAYNGVAILSRYPMQNVARDLPGFQDMQKRLIAATLITPFGPLRLINVYVVNGEEVGSDKFCYKLHWLSRLRDYLRTELVGHERLIVAGDYNVAPEDQDVYDPTVWVGRVLCTEKERLLFRALLELGLSDCFRLFQQPPGTFSWWDYRQASFRRNLGLRIDHLLASDALAAHCSACFIDSEPRKLPRPSDHAPVVATFNLK